MRGPLRIAPRLLLVCGVTGLVVLGGVATGTPASAHPLGNLTVNHYDGLTIAPDRLSDTAVEDVAEIPTQQRRGLIDLNGDGRLSPDERSAYAGSQCATLVRDVSAEVLDGARSQRVALAVDSSSYVETPGQVSLDVGRLTCELSGPLSLPGARDLRFRDDFDGEGVGWHEVTAVGSDVTLHDSPFPRDSISDELRHYPNNLLSSPLDVRGGTLRVEPGAGASTYALAKKLPVAGPAVRALDRLARVFNDTVGRKHLTLGVGLLAVALSMLLGAGHAFLPGHGKTIMAAYLVGRRGRLRDVVTVGATVTITHTAGVLLLGFAISASTAFAPVVVEQVLGVISGGIVAGVGLWLLLQALRRRRGGGALTSTLAASSAELATVTADGRQLVNPVIPAVEHEPVRALVPGAPRPVLVPAGAPLADHGHSHADHGHSHADHGHSHADHGHSHDDHGHAHAAPAPTDHPHPHAHDDRPHGDDDHVHPPGEHGHVHDHGDHGHSHDHGEPALAHAGHAHDHAHSDHEGHGGHGDHAHDHLRVQQAAPHRHGLLGGHGHSHGPGGHSHGPVEGGFSKGGLVGLGVAGGLVPSPSALLVLLAASALGRTVFGVVLVLGYGFGMALALTAAGLLLVKLRGRLEQWSSGTRLARADRLLAVLPVLTALLVTTVGVGLALRAVSGTI